MNTPAHGRGTASDLKVDVVSDYGSLSAMAKTWNQVYEQAGADNPFLTHDWMLSWWEAFGGHRRMHVLIVKCGETPVAIAPLMLSSQKILGIPMRCVQSIWNEHTPRMDFIVAGNADEVYSAIWDHILARRSLWNVLQLNQIPEDSPTLRQLACRAERDGMPWALWSSSNSPFVPMTGDWDAYFSTLSNKHRANLRNRNRRLEQMGPVMQETVSCDGNLAQSLEEGFRIEAASWKGEDGTAINCQPGLRQFYISLANRFARQGWLRLEFLNVAGRKIAFAYCFSYKSRLYLLKIGYDPAFHALSPFNLLCEQMIRHGFKEGLTELDFLGDGMTWKLDWAREQRSHYWLYIFRNSILGRALHRGKFHWLPRLRHHLAKRSNGSDDMQKADVKS